MKDNSFMNDVNDDVLKDIGSLESATEDLNEYDFDAEEVESILTIIGKALLAIFK